MTDQRSYRYLIYSLFLLSGVSGLIYQIVWTRELVLVFGNTMLATATVLSAFMGGLAAGSYILGRYIDRKPRALVKLYGILEGGVGLFGLLFPLVVTAASPIYAALYPVVEGNIVLLNLVRFAVCFAIIVVPTFLMGGTLPVLIKRFSQSGSGIGHQTGFLYGLNTVGAVIGTFACGYFLLQHLGMQKTTWVAALINFAVAIAAWILGGRTRELPAPAETASVPDSELFADEKVYGRGTIRMVMIGIGLSGFCALAYEVFWTRMLNLFLHNNIYSFTAILATFLIGIAVGSLFYARFLSKSKHQLGIFVWLEIGIGLISYFTPFIFKIFHADLFNNFNESLTLAKTASIMIGPTVMMGIAVPLAIQICRRGVSKEGTSVGSVYATNTIGSILGAFAAGFILLPVVGLHQGVIIVASLNIIAGFLPLLTSAKATRRIVYALSGAVMVILMFVTAPPHLFRDLFQAEHPNADILVYKEGKVANVLVYDFKKLGYKDFHLNAVNEASSRLWHVQLFKMLGILPTLVHDSANTDALMVAFGAGMSAGATATNVKSLDVVDLNPDIQGVAAAYTRENLDVINQPNFHQIVNDGRNALMLSDKKYSLIISDATNPKMFDSWTLYSQEFYETVKSRLKPGGVFCQWALIPLPADAIKVLLNTFRSVFPHMSFWVIHGSSQVLMLGTPERLEIDYNDLAKRLEPLYEKTDLAEFGIDSPEKFLSFFMLGEDGVEEMLKGYDKISTDDLPHAQFHITQDEEGYDNCLDLVRYQESITKYMKDPDNLPDSFLTKMVALEDIGRRLDLGFLSKQNNRFAEAEVIAHEANLQDANVAHHLNHCPEKKRHFERRLETHPDDATAHNWLGNICMLDGEYDRALEQLNKALKLEPDHAYAKMNLAMTYVEMGRYDDAVEDLLELTHRNPNRPIQRTASDLLKRIRLLRELEYAPENAQLHRALGVLYFNNGEPLKSIEEYRKSIELGDDTGETLYNLARIYERLEMPKEAAFAYSRLADKLPENIEVAQKAQFYSGLEANPDQRRTWLNQRIVVPDLTPVESDHPATCDEALEIWRGEDPERMIDTTTLVKVAELFNQSSETKPDDLHAYTEAATIYEAIGQYDKAKADWLGAFKLKPEFKVYETNARRADILKELDGESLDQNRRLQLLLELAYTYQQAGSFERAMKALEKARQVDPDNDNITLVMAETAVLTGQWKKAETIAAQIKPDTPNYAQAEKIRQSLSDLKK